MPDHLGSDMRKQKKDVDPDDDKPFQGRLVKNSWISYPSSVF